MINGGLLHSPQNSQINPTGKAGGEGEVAGGWVKRQNMAASPDQKG